MLQLRNGKALLIDLEMTCWEGGVVPPGMRREVLEIGLVEIDTKEMVIAREGSWLVRPIASEVTPYCSALTGITPEEVARDGRPLREVLRTIANEFGPARKSLLAWGDDWSPIEIDCRHQDCQNPFPRDAFLNVGHVASLLWSGSGRLGLDDARVALGKPDVPGRHRALPDARATAEVVIEMSRLVREHVARATFEGAPAP